MGTPDDIKKKKAMVHGKACLCLGHEVGSLLKH